MHRICNEIKSLSTVTFVNFIYLPAYPRVEHLKGVPVQGSLLALPTNIRPGRKSLPGTNTLTHYEKSFITIVTRRTSKSSLTANPRSNSSGFGLIRAEKEISFEGQFTRQTKSGRILQISSEKVDRKPLYPIITEFYFYRV